MPDSRHTGVPDSYSVSSRKQGNNYLFVVGIDTYKTHPYLYNCVRDARGLIAVLTQQYQFNDVDEERILLENENASRDGILDALDGLIEKLKPEDTLLIFFACHGFYKKSSRSGYLVPHDGNKESKNLISTDEIKGRITRSKAHHVFLIVDTCFSGSIFRALEQVTREDEEAYAEEVDCFASRYGLAAGRIELVSDGIAGDHSPLTGKIIHFLQNSYYDTFTVSSLIYHITRNVHSDKDSRQTPIGGVLDQEGHHNGELVFRRKAAFSKVDGKISTTKVFALHKKINRLRQLEALEILRSVSKNKVRIVLIQGKEEDYPENLIEHFVKKYYNSQVHWKIDTDHNPPRLEYIPITDQVKSYKEACFKMLNYWGLQDQQITTGEEILSKFPDPKKPLILPIKLVKWAPHSIGIVKEIMEKFWGLFSTKEKEVYVFITIICVEREVIDSRKFWKTRKKERKDLPNRKALKKLKKFISSLENDFCERVCALPELGMIPTSEIRKFTVDNHNKFPYKKSHDLLAYLEEKEKCNIKYLSMLQIEEWIKLNVS